MVGGAIELVWGTLWAISLHLAAGLGGALVSASLSSQGSMSVGASGCVHGFLAAACVERRAALLLPWVSWKLSICVDHMISLYIYLYILSAVKDNI